MKSIIFTVCLGLCSLFQGIATAQNKVVVVPLFDTSPTGVAAIPIYCPQTFAGFDSSNIMDCFRADTRSSVDPVPDGHFLFITDITVNNNTRGLESGASFELGRDNSGTQFPREPSHEIRAVLPKTNHIKFATPYIILRGGERLRLASSGFINGLAEAGVDVSASGYLVKTDRFGR